MRKFSIQHVRRTPAGWKVRTKRVGTHELRIAFPPGRRRRGSGEVVEILHPKRENPRSCLTRARKNPLELLVFGNPTRTQHIRAARERGEEIRRVHGQFRRANPSAANLYEQFHQEDPAETLEFNEPQDMPRHTAVLGDLIAIGYSCANNDRNHQDYGREYSADELVEHSNWRHCPRTEFENDDVKVSANPSGTQLYFVGGNQDLRAQLKDFGKAGATGRVKLGPAAFIVYATRKGMDGFKMSDYIHKFGEDSGVVGNYWFDADDRRILIRGGDYRVTPDGIVN